MKITAPLKDEEVLRRSIRGYFDIEDENEEFQFPVATIRKDGDRVIAEGNEGEYTDSDIRGLYHAIDASFPRDAWEAKFPELLP